MAQKRSRAAFEADLQAQQSPYVFFGTPLPPLDRHTRDDGSYVPVWQQEVTDERGRKRLHGAFTGGFSAGYFNSVGSKEGWTPQTFVSSRANRAKAVQKAEDFMDDEDLADAEEAKVLETKGGFSGFGSTQDEIGGQGPFMDLFRLQGESMGVKLLKKMGWSEGQGIGTERRKPRTHSEHDPGGHVRGILGGTPGRMISFVRKMDTKGLDIDGDAGVSSGKTKGNGNSASVATPINKPSKSKPKRGGFGVGILNDTGSDEEDPYDVGPKLSYGRVAADKKKKKADLGTISTGSNPLLSTRPTFVKKSTLNAGFRRCHDGKLPIDGFVLSVKGPVVQDKKYPPPSIPEGWTPSRQAKVESADASSYQSTADLAKASRLNPTSRAAMLGESALPGQSVFDFISPAARDKLATASKRSDLPAGNYTAPASAPAPPSEEELIPQLDPEVAATALQKSTTGFVPYSDDPSKLGRYRGFLTYRANRDSAMAAIPKCAPGVRREDFLSELQEFANAATVFKPMTGAMANRFTSSTSSSNVQASTVAKDDEGKDIPLLSKGGRQLAPEEEAAKLGMYGPLTRVTAAFYPTRLLCKRFAISPPLHVQPEPENGSVATSSGAGTRAAKSGHADILAGFGNRFTSGGVQSSESDDPASKKNKLEIVGKKDMDEMRRAAGLPALGEVVRRKEREVFVDPTRNEALEAQRPSDETFREIFANED